MNTTAIDHLVKTIDKMDSKIDTIIRAKSSDEKLRIQYMTTMSTLQITVAEEGDSVKLLSNDWVMVEGTLDEVTAWLVDEVARIDWLLNAA